jgi:hypothetical protein
MSLVVDRAAAEQLNLAVLRRIDPDVEEVLHSRPSAPSEHRPPPLQPAPTGPCIPLCRSSRTRAMCACTT